MVMSSKAISKMVGADVGKTLESINMLPQSERMDKRAFKGPDIKADETIKAAVTPQKAPSFAEAFRAARAEKGAGKTFTFGGKSFSTNMVGEGAKRPQSVKAAAPKGSSSPLGDFYTSKFSDIKGNAANIKGAGSMDTGKPSAPADKPTPSPTRKSALNAGRSKGFLAGMFDGDAASNFSKAQEKKYGKPSGRSVLLTGKEAREANKRQGTIGGYAKGGSIDGCAIRGKTRASMKKGK